MRRFAAAAALAVIGQAAAQDAPVPVEQTTPPPVEAPVAPPAEQTSATTLAAPATEIAPAEPALNPDEMADYLNAQQQIKQTFTLERRIDGRVVETDKRTVVYSRTDPVYATESGATAFDRLKAAFAAEVLTRTDAFKESKLDFVIADLDRDGQMTADEFVHLVSTWRENEARDAAPGARERQHRAFIDGLDPAAAQEQLRVAANAKFAFMAGAKATLGRMDYIREYLLDFDSMDLDNDSVLKAEELMKFRALNRGETLAAAQ